MGWNDIKTMDMEDEIKKLKKEIMDMKNIDKRCNTYVGINNDLKNWATFLPLLGELKDPSIETEDDRHWNKIKDLVKPQTF
jgi:dynein heavy chain